MKKIISILMTMAITMSMAVTAMANPDITVLVDGVKVEFDAQPEMVNERTMVPMRAIFEEFGAKVSWDQPTQTVTAVTATKIVVATIGDMSMYVNDEEKVMDVAPYVKDDRTYVPARFIAEALDCQVDWDQATYTVKISSGVDEEYLYSYNAIKNFAMANGKLYEDGAWVYYELLDGIDVYVAYDETVVQITINKIVEGWDIIGTVIAARNGIAQVDTSVTNEYGDSRLAVSFKDGKQTPAIEEFGSVTETTMRELTNACIDIIDEVAPLIDEECELIDFGITSQLYY